MTSREDVGEDVEDMCRRLRFADDDFQSMLLPSRKVKVDGS